MIEPESGIPLDVVYEDKDIVVINKQAGLIVHPTLSKKKHTLANALVERYPEIIGVGESPFRPELSTGLIRILRGLSLSLKIRRRSCSLRSSF